MVRGRRSSKNFASDSISPMSCSRLNFCFLGSCPVKRAIEAHDVVVVDQGRGEEDELEIELVDVVARDLSSLPPASTLLAKALCGFEEYWPRNLSTRPWATPARWLLFRSVRSVYWSSWVWSRCTFERVDERQRGRRRP